MARRSEIVGAARRVEIWIRVSTEDQAQGDSPEHHERRARHYAEAKDWSVVEVYRLEAVSGKAMMAHPEAKRMLADYFCDAVLDGDHSPDEGTRTFRAVGTCTGSD